MELDRQGHIGALCRRRTQSELLQIQDAGDATPLDIEFDLC